MLRYLKNHQNPDGGIGLHIEGHSTMFGTSLNYVAARLLGLPADDPWAVACRKFMHARGGAVNNVAGSSGWRSSASTSGAASTRCREMWLLPYSLSSTGALLVPRRMVYCRCRTSSAAAACLLTPTTPAKLYPVPYAEVHGYAPQLRR